MSSGASIEARVRVGVTWALLFGLGACAADDGAVADAGSLDDGQADGGLSSDAGDAPAIDVAPPPPVGLAAKYPRDVGLSADPAVVWAENYEEGSMPALLSRYDSVKSGGLALVPDAPPLSAGKASGRFRASPQAPASDLYKRFPKGYDELFVRYYVKYQPGIHWHHSSVWFGGYAPSLLYPSPQAGTKPNGDDRISIAIEPAPGDLTKNPLLDFYDYWMTMRSWMDVPQGNTAYYGNTLIHRKDFFTDDGAWMCIEMHAKLNPNGATAAGAELDVWKNDVLVRHFDDQAPLGYWVKDKFCPNDANTPACTNYTPPSNVPREVLDLRWRSTTALKLDYFWPQNYITEGPQGDLEYDDMVVATQRIGCMSGP